MSRRHIHLPRPTRSEVSWTNKPKLIVIHAMGQYINDLFDPLYAPEFLNKYGYSAHSLIDVNGDNIRCRHDSEMAYHAKSFNRDSLGMEFLVKGEHDYGSFLEAIKTDYLEESQFLAGVYQCREWMNLHDIQEIARHSDKSPGRKVDPGSGFPWEDFLYEIGR